MSGTMDQRYGIINPFNIEHGIVSLNGFTHKLCRGRIGMEYVGCRFMQLSSAPNVFIIEGPKDRDARLTMPLQKPRGGDAVILAAPWMEAKAGDVGIVEGLCDSDPEDDEVQITFRYSAFVGDSPELASVSGGPGTIGTPISELRLLPDIYEYNAWMWRNGRPAGNNAHHYKRKARLWEWTPVKS